ncbi:MAG: DNA polymerase III subunit gamma/tau [Clostridiales bacterium]|nr:DNA polymerase III subunit gamma/tau [Clostridiales bacterium]
MAYLALYRRFRPNGFDGLIGQEHIVRTLANQINTGRIGHAYLFCGTRGTGKTSAAKIFAKAINCLSPKNGSPCGECEVCKALADPSNLDILEMDAASNNKVENVREIREKIQYPPVSGKYKVYIIDEVHMLTTEAFNALLKTLEEPPKHAVFILATTEVHKLPSTILSRCMRFDFRIIPVKEIANLIGKIYDEVGKEYDGDAITAIARAGNGSVRDALSIADICVSYRDSKLTYNDVLEVLGATDSTKITQMINKMVVSNTGGTLEDVEELCETGKSIGVLCKDIISRLREVVICKTCKNGKEILELPEDVYSSIKEIAEKADEHRLLRIIEIFTEAEGNLRYSLNPRVVLESACIKASEPQNDYNIDALLSRISKLEEQLKEGAVAIKTEVKSISEVKPVVKEKPKKIEEYPVFDDGYPDVPPEEPFEQGGFYGDVVAEKKVDKRPIGGDFIKNEPQKDEIKQVEKDNGENLKPSTDVGGMTAGKIWGRVVRQLRADKNIVLWVACQEMEARLSGRTLKIIANDDAGYQAVIKEANLLALSKTVKSIGDYDVEIVKNGEESVDEFTENVEKVKNTFSGITVKVED